MKTAQYLLRGNHAFYKNWWEYAVLIVGIQAVVKHMFIPLYTGALEGILSVFRINYLSYNNLSVLLKYGGLPLLSVLLLALIVLLTAYLQFAFMLIYINRIAEGQDLNLVGIGRAALNSLYSLSLPTVLIFVAYVAIALPAASSFFTSSLLKKLVIPDFIYEFLSQNGYYAIMLTVTGLALTYISIRLVQVLPLMLISGHPFGESLKMSWQQTRGRLFQYLIRVVLIASISAIGVFATKFLGILMQEWVDHAFNDVAFTSSIILTTLIQIIEVLIKIFENTMLAFIIIFPDEIPLKKSQLLLKNVKRPRLVKTVVRSLIAGAAGLLVIFNITYLVGSFSDARGVWTISHRGVDDGNGVQNTIPALEKTSQKKPDYVEMDLHETKDLQFVVMHDENLATLTGVDKIPHDMTLDEITKLTAHENGHEAKVASFDDYLATAERLHQKLLVEIKTTTHDSPQMMAHFKEKYGKRLIQDHDMLHSLDYRVINKSESMMPKLPASFILPYTLILPNTNADMYTLEATTLNQHIVDEAHGRNQKVLAWTINDQDDMEQMIFMDTDGIITDNLSILKDVIKEQSDNPTYAQRMAQLLDLNWQSAF